MNIDAELARFANRGLQRMLSHDAQIRRRRVGAESACHPSWTTSKSSAVSALNAGFSTSLFHRASIVPLMYMSEPLSATIRP